MPYSDFSMNRPRLSLRGVSLSVGGSEPPCNTKNSYILIIILIHRDGHETSMAEAETRRLQVSRRDRDVKMHVVFNAVQVNVGLTTVAILSPRVRLF